MLAGIEEAVHARKSFEVIDRKSAVGTILAGLIDYAGLYPPAGLDMRRAVQNYLAYRTGKHAYALGRFIVDVNRIDELRAAAGSEIANLALSVIIPPGGDCARIAAFLDQGIRIESAETRPPDLRSLAQVGKSIPSNVETYIEVPIGSVNDEALVAIGDAGARIKLRMGGVVPEAFPSVEAVTSCLVALERHRLPFKATAGLHHPVRSPHRLTYTPESPTGMMHGFVNLFCAAALIHFGGSAVEAVQLLEEQNPRAWDLSLHSLSWRTRSWTVDQLSETRKTFVSFGSCSFEEPMGDLEAMGWL